MDMRHRTTENPRRNSHASDFDEDFSTPHLSDQMDDEHHSIHSTRTQTPEGVSTAFRAQTPAGTVKRKFRSYTLREPYEKPWLADPNFKKTRVNNWIVLAFVFLGCVGAALYIYFTIQPYIPQPVSVHPTTSIRSGTSILTRRRNV